MVSPGQRIPVIWGFVFLASYAHAGDWQWQNPYPRGSSFYAVWSFSSTSAIAAGAGAAIVYTSDGGVTWNEGVGTEVMHGSFRSLYFINGQKGFAAGDNGWILRTFDGGVHWSKAGNTGFQGAINGVGAGENGVLVAVCDSGIVLRSTNDGTDWRRISVGGRRSLKSVSLLGSTGWASGDSGFVYRTTDAGATWAGVRTGAGQTLSGIAFLDLSVGVAVGAGNSIWRTSDGGDSWDEITFGVTLSIKSVRAGTPNRFYGAGPTGMLLSTNAGISWDSRQADLQASFMDAAFTDTSAGWLAGVGGAISRTTDGGSTWQSRTRGTRENIGQITASDPGHVIALGENGRVILSSDGGLSFSIHQPAAVGVVLTQLDYPDSLHSYAASDSGIVFATHDGGANWTRLTAAPGKRLYTVSFPDSLNGWAGGARTLCRTTDGGASWEQRPLADTAYTVTSMKFFGPDRGVMLVVGLDGRRIRMLATSDAGVTWSGRENPSTAAVTAFSFIDSAVGWAVANGNTLFHTVDGGFSWQTQRLPLNKLYTSVTFVSELLGWTCSSDGYLLKTTDGGTTWAQLELDGSLPVSNIVFTDASHGWAAGLYGTILHTFTGGGTGILYPGTGPPPVKKAAPPVMSNFPNPARYSTSLPFDNQAAGFVTIQVCNLQGTVVRNLVHAYMAAGQYRLDGKAPRWNCDRDDGSLIPSGVYFYRIVTPARTLYGKLVVVH